MIKKIIIQDKLFKECLGSFATGVTVISTFLKDKPLGITINSFFSVSLSPPLIGFCLKKESFAHSVFLENNFFVVNILNKNQDNLSKKFAQTAKNNWNDVNYSLGETKMPVIEDVISFLECKKHQTYDGGDHSIFLGEIVNLDNNKTKQPLTYFRGNYNNI